LPPHASGDNRPPSDTWSGPPRSPPPWPCPPSAPFCLAWADLDRDAESPTADVHLKHEHIIEGRVVDSTTAPIAGATVRVSLLGIPHPEIGSFDGLNYWDGTPDHLDAIWPATAHTDPDGRFRITGIGQGVQASLQADASGYAQQMTPVTTTADATPANLTILLDRGIRVSGRVTRKSDGHPIADARVEVRLSRASLDERLTGYRTECQTDAEGRYEVRSLPNEFLSVTVYPPVGTPELIYERNHPIDPKSDAQTLDLSVPSGTLITGQITEQGTGRPLPGSSVYADGGNVVDGEGTISGFMSAVPADATGRYAIAVEPGKGTLVVYGPTNDFVHQMRGSNHPKPGGERHYAHAFVDYDVTPASAPVVKDVALTPGTTVTGRVVGPDGSPVESAEIITTLSISPFHTFWRGDFTITVRNGRFTLHGVPTDRAVKCSFLDAQHSLGATLDISAPTAADGPLTVTLQPCGQAAGRIVNEQGQPVPDSGTNLHIIATPGPGTDFGVGSLDPNEKAQLAADEEIYANVDRRNDWTFPHADANARQLFDHLIPGATYRFYEPAPSRGPGAARWRDFTVAPAQTTDLGDIHIRTQPN
jgi:hypothetical protein